MFLLPFLLLCFVLHVSCDTHTYILVDAGQANSFNDNYCENAIFLSSHLFAIGNALVWCNISIKLGMHVY